MAAPPDVLRWAPRSAEHGDCAVAALQIACGVTYEMALAASLSAQITVLSTGLRWHEIRKAAKLLGFTTQLVRREKVDLEEDTGLLDIRSKGERTGSHIVYLWEGRIIEPMHELKQLWLDPNMYLQHYKFTHGSLLVLKRED